MSYKIGIDISGGDSAPNEIIKGALLAKKELSEDIILIGVEEEIREQLKLNKASASDFTIVNAPEKIEMAESPAKSVLRKKNS